MKFSDWMSLLVGVVIGVCVWRVMPAKATPTPPPPIKKVEPEQRKRFPVGNLDPEGLCNNWKEENVPTETAG